MIERRLLAIYLNDHLAGATGGVELARRARSSNRGSRWGVPLDEICAEVEADRDTLGEIMESLAVRRNTAKVAGAWAAEKLGRLKLNGRLRGYSPLSRLVELEMLHIGITGKLELWQALQRTLSSKLPDVDFAALLTRAESQRQALERLRIDAAAEALAGELDDVRPNPRVQDAGGSALP
ncbi:MAG TPA: hypothetical protein VFN89_00280 [Solirubrobacterales bacterium]|nr:hypothetical protein [Solirubrobacterales bacterium]